jgi:polyhydroxyalkanoate synthesis regulator phasin
VFTETEPPPTELQAELMYGFQAETVLIANRFGLWAVGEREAHEVREQVEDAISPEIVQPMGLTREQAQQNLEERIQRLKQLGDKLKGREHQLLASIRALFDGLNLPQRIEAEIEDLLEKSKQLNRRLQAVADALTQGQGQQLAKIRNRIDAAKTGVAGVGDIMVKRVTRDDDFGPPTYHFSLV